MSVDTAHAVRDPDQLAVYWPEQTDVLLELAYETGRFDERRRIATAAAELDERWRASGATWYRDWIADSIARSERIAADNPAATWRGNFPGGPTIRRSTYARAVRPFRFRHDPDAYEFVPDDGPESALVLVAPVPWEPVVARRGVRPVTATLPSGTDDIEPMTWAQVRLVLDPDAAPESGCDDDEAYWDALMASAPAVDDLAPAMVESEPKPIVQVDPEAIWSARPVLGHIQNFARARRVSPWAVLGATLAQIVVAVPPFVVLPPLTGGPASLNLFVGLTGKSGDGKGAAESVAGEAIDITTPMPAPTGPGSGEGMAHMFMRRVRDPNDKTKTIIEQHTTSVLLTVPEIDTLAALTDRRASTLLPELRKAWTGETLGFAYADPEKRLPVPAHRYRLSLIVGIQPARAGGLLADADGGTPQRFIWLPASDPDAPDVAPETPSPWSWSPPARWPNTIYSTGLAHLPVCKAARDLVDAARVARLRGHEDALNGHALLARLKVAAALAMLDERAEVADADWDLAELVMLKSDETRQSVIEALSAARANENRRRGESDAERAILIDDRMTQAAIKRVCRSIMRKLTESQGQSMAHSELRKKIHARDREHFDTAIESLISTGQITAAQAFPDDYGRAYGQRYEIPRGAK